MSVSQALPVWFHAGSALFPAVKPPITFRLVVAAFAAKPQRDGVNQAICSITALPWIGKIPPVVTTWTMTSRKTSGIARPAVLTAADTRKPIAIEAMPTRATDSMTSTIGIGRNAPFGGDFDPGGATRQRRQSRE